jgi:hypothetical protein
MGWFALRSKDNTVTALNMYLSFGHCGLLLALGMSNIRPLKINQVLCEIFCYIHTIQLTVVKLNHLPF